ncbi:MAG: NFACT family protein [Clostridiaceae bacterium]
MALDALFLHSTVHELQSKLIDARVSKVNQPEKDEIVLQIRTRQNENLRLLISANSSYPKIHFTKNQKENPQTPPLFNMVLRKYLNGSKIIDVKQYNCDRIVIISFLSTDELGVNSQYDLIVEIMGRHSNISLVRSRDNIIMDCIKHITPEINRYRSLFPSIQYVFPPDSEKLNPFNFTLDDLISFINENHVKINNNLFGKVFTGISSETSKEIFKLTGIENEELTKDDYTHIVNIVKKFLVNFNNNTYSYNLYFENSTIKSFYCVDLTIYHSLTKKEFHNSSELIEEFYEKSDKKERLASKTSNLLKLVNTNLERCLKKNEIIKNTLNETDKKDTFKLYGELLTSNIYSIKPGMKEISVVNYYDESGSSITIPLNEFKSPSENVQIYFKKYTKLKKSEEMAQVQKKNNEEEINYLNSVQSNLQLCETNQDIDEIKEELVSEGYVRFSKLKKNKKQKPTKPLHFVSEDGYDIYVGKNNIQNDTLTLKFATKQDLWFHTKNIPGSHVVIKTKTSVNDIPESTILEAGNLAAYYSKARNSSKIPVDYTEIKNVKKPNGSKAGMVIYSTNKTLYVTPTEPK